jgi:pimeloyl-ACP methyl ester carboxylesterase
MTAPRRFLALCAACVLAGCGLAPAYVPDPNPLEPGRLPAPDVTVEITQLRSCTDSPDATLRLNSREPVAVLVHGCRGSAGHFRALAQLYAFHGQQAVCFAYDPGDSLVKASGELITALDRLSGRLRDRDITVIGHSMGGLVARKAMELERRAEWQRDDARIRLATVSAPFAGIAVASPCGNKALHWLSLGLVPGICRAITGDNWFEITAASSFIRRPGALLPTVHQYLKIVTDERDTCRRRSSAGTCLESDYIFSLEEQYHPVIDRYPRLKNVEVRAGHVEIVGYKDVQPRKLLQILQQEGMMAATPPERRAALERLLAELY